MGEASKYRPDTDNINTTAVDTLTRGQEITQFTDLPSVDPLDIMVYTSMCDHY